MIAMAGMNPLRFLNSTDTFEKSVMVSIANRRVGIAAEEREDLAERIISTLGKSMKG